MSGGLPRGAGLTWSPRQLARSLPMHRRLWFWRALAIAMTVASGAWALWQGLAAAFPGVEPDPDPESVVVRHVSGLEVPPWDPGPALAPSARPPWEAFPLPPLWRSGSVGDPPLSGRARELAAQGRRELQAENFETAATSFLRAANLQPAWEVLYSAGLALHKAGDSELAAERLAQADERLQQLESTGSPGVSGPRFRAAQVATRYAAGLAALEFDCLDAILHLRRSVRALDVYVDAEGAFVRDRRRPFRVREAGIDNHAVWATLARAYDRCEGKFPADYERRNGRAQDFAQEYRGANVREITGGPFASALAACVAGGTAGPSSRCWAYSNLNKPVWASRVYFARPDPESVGRGLEPTVLASLTRLVYDAAWLAAGHDKDRARASTYLGYAARLDRKAEVPGLAGRIAGLGRHLAPTTKDYSFLAEPWRRRDLTSLTLGASLKPQEVKGAAAALRERWVGHLRAGQPDLMIEEVESQLRRAGPHGKSLRSWRDEVQAALRQALVSAMHTERANGNLATALAIREYEASWLGPDWPDEASGAWITWDIQLRWLVLALLWLTITALVWLGHSLVVFPYLVYTTDFYRLEHRRRHAERRRLGKPFTRDEIEGI
jgi:hypothetical protein